MNYLRGLFTSVFIALIFSGGAFAQLSPGGGGLSGIPDPLNINEFLAGDGSASSPAYAFQNESGIGMYYGPGANNLNFSIDNTREFWINKTDTYLQNNNLAVVSGNLVAGAASAGSTSAFTAYADGSGIFRVGSSGGTASTSADDLVVENSAAAGITILTPVDSAGRIHFGTATDNTEAGINYSDNISTLRIGTVKVGGVTELMSGDFDTNLTLSGATGSELAEFAGDVDVGGGLDSTGAITAPSISFDSGTNALDFYEEGTWTPVLEDLSGDAAGGTTEGHYQRIGNMVIASADIDIMSVAGMSTGTGTAAELYISGFPYSSYLSSGVTTNGAAPIVYGAGDFDLSPGDGYTFYIRGPTQSSLRGTLSYALTGFAAIHVGEILDTSSGSMRFTITYMTSD